MQIIKHSKRIEQTTYTLFYESKETRGWGYGFDCTCEGTLLESNHPSYLSEVLAHPERWKEPQVQSFHHAHTIPAVGRCACGAEVELGQFTNTCRCGIDYNFAGQRLAARAQWGEETGEAWYECY